MIDDVAAVAQSLAYARPGSRLVAYQPLGLPAYQLRLEAVVQKKKPIPAIEEFVLASIDAGVDQPDDIAGFLGLDTRLAERALVTQLGDGHVAYAVLAGGARRLTLTPRGAEALRKLASDQPERTELTVPFDRLRWRVAPIPERSLLPPRDFAWACVKPRRTRTPTLDEVDLDDVANATAAAFGRREARRDPDAEMQVLNISAIPRAESRYLLGAALVYRPAGTADCDLLIAVNGRLDMDYTEAVAGAGGRSELGIGATLERARDELDRATRVVRRGLAEDLPDEKHVDELRKRLVDLVRMLGTARVDGDEVAGGIDSLEGLRDEISHARQALHDLPVRFVEPWEHLGLLEDAFSRARDRLVILADAAGARTMNPAFLALLEKACRRGVRCVVSYRQEMDPPYGRESVERELNALADRLPRRLAIRRHEREIPGSLVVDGEWTTTQFPWLSFADNIGLRLERGLAITVQQDVDAAFARAIEGTSLAS